MSHDNVKTLHSLYEAFNRRDFDVWLQYVDPDVELHPGIMAPDSKSRYLGREALGEFFVTIATGPWETVIAEPKEMVETDDGRVLSIDRWRFRGRDGIEIERELPNLFTFRHGLIARIDGFTNRDEALEAVGLQE
jgi:ketosteroid isomerase-like protein